MRIIHHIPQIYSSRKLYLMMTKLLNLALELLYKMMHRKNKVHTLNTLFFNLCYLLNLSFIL